MTFLNIRFPDAVQANSHRTEREAVDIVKTDGGFEVRNVRQAQGLLEYDIDICPGDYSSGDLAAIKDLFKASRGGLYAFRFRDWDREFNTLADEVIGTGNGSQTAFQITRTWTVGGQSQVRNITRPASPLTVKKDGVVASSGYSIDYSTGILTFTAAPANGVVISVSGQYDIPVRFDLSLQATGIHPTLEQIETIHLVEVKE